jgi:hypothetical protein
LTSRQGRASREKPLMRCGRGSAQHAPAGQMAQATARRVAPPAV